MNPNDINPNNQPQIAPTNGGQSTGLPPANNQSNSSGQLPVFRNPLAQSYDDHTAQLPPIPTSPPPQPEPPQSLPNAPSTTAPPVVNPAPMDQSSPSPAPVVAASASFPAPIQTQSPVIDQTASAQPKVSELSDTPIKPAPVRLAPVPRSDDVHAAGLQASSKNAPFGTVHENTAPTPVIAPKVATSAPKTKSIWMIVAIAGGVVFILLAAIGFYTYQLTRNKSKTVATTTPSKAESVRDKTEKPIQPFSEKIVTNCYVAQALTPVVVDNNKDCSLSLTYGEQKSSSIFVSALSSFDIVTDNASENSAENSSSEIDMDKYMENLMSEVIDKDLVTERTSMEVGNLAATKVAGKKDANSNTEVAYTYIALPEEERVFGEKQFIAFIVTGAYNDEYSRKGYDQFLTTWSWK